MKETGNHRVAAAFINDYYNTDNPDSAQQDRNLHIHSIEVAGPYNVKVEPGEQFKKIFFVMPGNGVSDEDAAKQVLQKFAGRAYRRPATDEEVKELVELFKLARNDGNDFVGASKIALSAVLVSPNFLYRIEKEQSSDPNKPYAISDYELASRLSYFLWSSMPDDELLAKAAAGELHKPEVLKKQVKRLLVDEKSDAAGRPALRRSVAGAAEPRRRSDRPGRSFLFLHRSGCGATCGVRWRSFFDHLVREDRSVLDLLTADYTYMNERLGAALRGRRRQRGRLPQGAAEEFAPQRRADDGGRADRHGDADDNQPCEAGASLSSTRFWGRRSRRPRPTCRRFRRSRRMCRRSRCLERLSVHREDAMCNSCHSRMDPLGFALENFDGIGKWRTTRTEFHWTSTPPGVSPGGEAFKGSRRSC